MIQSLISRFSRCAPPRSEGVLHAWTNEDSSWHGSSRDLARGLDVTEVSEPTSGVGYRPPPTAVFPDTLPVLGEARR